MAEYIDKQAAIDNIEKSFDKETILNRFVRKIAISAVRRMKPADVQPVVRGRWVKDSDGLDICSECGEVALQRVFIKLPKKIVDLQMVQSAFCPNCGADMRGTQDE